MNNDLRSMMEAIDDIENAPEDFNSTVDSSDEAESKSEPDCASSLDCLKDIVSSLKKISQKFVDGTADADVESVLSEIKSKLETIVGEEDDLEECYGTDGMEPSTNQEDVPQYNEPNAPSYAARQGFVG